MNRRDELVERVARLLFGDRISEVFPGLFPGRSSQPAEMVHSAFKPAFCVIAQGSNQVEEHPSITRIFRWWNPGWRFIEILSRVIFASGRWRRTVWPGWINSR